MRTHFVSSWLVALLCALAASGSARAQEPDMRSISPFVMILADTSGSMEYRADCTCPETGGCTHCLPLCSEPNDDGIAPAGKKNRWAMLLESLTGSFIDFQCVPQDRTDPAHFTYDFAYSLPYHRPWTCPGGDTYCAYPGTESAPIQLDNGLLDNYANRIRFGLATFDGMRTYRGSGDLVTSFNNTLSTGAEGMYSYGGEKPVRYPTCTQTHYIDSGIRSRDAPEGGLVSLDTALCASPPCDPQVISDEIQRRLLATRPYGGTPTASALDDLYYHFKHDLNDPMTNCRDRYAILITDGYPDDDFREYPNPGCECDLRGNCPPGDDVGMSCPYPTAAQAAYNLRNGRSDDGSDKGQIAKLFVVGMSIANEKRDDLNLIASQGGSSEAYFADDPSTLTSTLDKLFGEVTKPISRSVPAFAIGESGTQYQVSAGFSISGERVPSGFSAPWKGAIERRRYVCDQSGVVTAAELTDDDRFDVQLNKRPGTDRWLWTALPENPDATKVQGKLRRLDPDTECGPSGCAQTHLRDVPATLLGNVDADRRTTLIQWMYGDDGSVRAKMKLGDIYHSSPAIVGPPIADPGDQSYTLFRESQLIDERPMMLYVNSNDGILHAFVLEDKTVGGTTYKAGHELWGFVPPTLLPELHHQLSAHRLNLDSTPVVKDVFFSKGSAPSATDYKTVLITGMRSGGNAYIALDVTDPVNPKFLWQFKGDHMGQTYGQPLIVQARYQWPPGQPATTRAMAILPGGKGELDSDLNFPGCDATSHSRTSFRVPDGSNRRYQFLLDPSLTAKPWEVRAEVPCWESTGRSLYFVDVETGKEIKNITFDAEGKWIFPSPVVGSPTAYQDAVGMVATQGFVLDADGVLWRIDLSSTDQREDDALAGWTVRPFYDLFWDMGPSEGETTYERPILSLDERGQLVVIIGTGDTDNFEKREVRNRVASVTQLAKVAAPAQPSDYIAGLNWELRADDQDDGRNLMKSELITGTMALFAQQLFVASFIALPGTDPCDEGLGRLWSLHYKDRDTIPNVTNASAAVTFGPKRIAVNYSGSNADAQAVRDLNRFNVDKANAEKNLLVLGLGSTQRISSCEVGPSLDGNYYQPGSTIANISQNTNPSIWIVGQASSGSDERKRARSDFGTLEVQVARPIEFSRVSSWAGSIE